jgi:hypothetical protein
MLNWSFICQINEFSLTVVGEAFYPHLQIDLQRDGLQHHQQAKSNGFILIFAAFSAAF